jgi:hypothetical protein
MVLVIEGERGKERLSNDAGGTDESTDARGRISERMTPAEMEAELDKRVEMMREGGGGDGVTDQFRVYEYIIQELEAERWLRLMVQASAGDTFSFMDPVTVGRECMSEHAMINKL